MLPLHHCGPPRINVIKILNVIYTLFLLSQNYSFLVIYFDLHIQILCQIFFLNNIFVLNVVWIRKFMLISQFSLHKFMVKNSKCI